MMQSLSTEDLAALYQHGFGAPSDSGELGRIFAASFWYPPAVVRVEEDWLLWMHDDPDPTQPERRAVQAQERMLTDFLALVDEPDERIAEYALEWGVLGFCEHGLPASHNPPAWPLTFDERYGFGDKEHPLGLSTGCRLMREGEVLAEPLEGWRRLSAQFVATLRLASAVQSGDLGDARDWERIYQSRPEGDLAFWIGRGYLAHWMNQLLALANVGLSLDWSTPQPSINIEVGGLFGALTSQLLFTLGRSHGVFFCAECGTPFFPAPEQPRRRRNYCSPCRASGAPQRHASRDYRRKQREKEQRRAS